MSFAPDFDSFTLIGSGLTCLGTIGLMGLIYYIDADVRNCPNRKWFFVLKGISFVQTFIIYGVLEILEGTMLEKVSIIILGIYLGATTIMDVLLCQVSDFLQYVGVLGGALWIFSKEIEPPLGISLILFGMIQYLIFMRMYGKADGMAFCVCAMYFIGLGFDMEMCLYHMGISVVLLAMVQALCGNISCKGNLKRKVAMYPYITSGFWILFLQIFG